MLKANNFNINFMVNPIVPGLLALFIMDLLTVTPAF